MCSLYKQHLFRLGDMYFAELKKTLKSTQPHQNLHIMEVAAYYNHLKFSN